MPAVPLVPHGLPSDAGALNAPGTQFVTPNVGDLWMLAWDHTDLGLALISAVREGYVLFWPVTDNSFAASAPCFYVKSDATSTALVTWPEAEAGISNALLSRRIEVTTLHDTSIRAVHDALRGAGSLPEDVTVVDDRDDYDADIALNTVCLFASSVSDIEWTSPAAGRSPLSTDALQQHGVTPREIASITPMVPATARALFDGKRIAPASLVESLAQRHRISVEQLLGPIQGAAVDVINQPALKAEVVELATRRSTSEAMARSAVWEASQRAARTVGQDVSIDAHVRQALRDLLDEDPGSSR